jgi:hypothetical protein
MLLQGFAHVVQVLAEFEGAAFKPDLHTTTAGETPLLLAAKVRAFCAHSLFTGGRPSRKGDRLGAYLPKLLVVFLLFTPARVPINSLETISTHLCRSILVVSVPSWLRGERCAVGGAAGLVLTPRPTTMPMALLEWSFYRAQ